MDLRQPPLHLGVLRTSSYTLQTQFLPLGHKFSEMIIFARKSDLVVY
ncbi:MAG: hypothetical protein QOF67_2524, partial [Mycobacterium sp.]|nr:hypothetical protein [Mycobacterium sp.]